MSQVPTAIDRRTLLRRTTLGGLSLAAASGPLSRMAWADGNVVNVAAYGGVVNEYLAKVFGAPFEKETGIKVNWGSNASLALAKLQSTSGAPAQWDIVVLTGAEYLTAIEQNLISPWDYSLIDSSNIPPEYKQSHGVKFSLYLFVMAWDKRVIPDDKAPKTLADFWDTNRYKGKRSLYSNISDGSTLEFALLADGVPLNKLYPLDVDRALRSLERLGRDNIIWHSTNQEPVQQLTSGAVSLATAFDGRLILANRAGGQIGFTPDYSAVSGNPYCVIATSERKKEAFKLLNYMLTQVEADAEYMKLTNYAVPNTKALALVPPEVLDILPTSPTLKDKVFIKDDVWWAENLAKTTQKFREWQLAG
jgi:putative spermidine/putrescine transport system substrate-binding protein